MVMEQYRFYLDNTLVNDPQSWDDSKIKFARHDELMALIYEYITDLVFIGSAYQYLLGVINTDGYCKEVVIVIEKNCNGTYNKLFQGRITLYDAKVDEYNCSITVNAEPDTLINQIINFSENEYYLDFSKGIGWTCVPTTPRTIGIYNKDKSITSNRTGYFVIDALQFLVNCMTQGINAVTVVSDYFQNDVTQPQITTVKYNSPSQLLGVGTNTIVLTNYFGETFVCTAGQQVTAACALENLIINIRGDVAATNQVTEFYENDFSKPNQIISNGTDTLTFKSYLPFTIDNVYQGFNIPQNHTITTTQDVSDGMKYLSLMTGSSMRGVLPAPAPLVSFKKLFEELHKQFNLGMSIENVGGVITMRIEPISYFFFQTNQIELRNVPDLKYEISNRFTKNQIKVGDGSDKTTLKAGIQDASTWYSGQNCQSNKIDCKNEFICNYADIDIQRTATTDKFDEKIYLIECEQSGGNYIAKAYLDDTTTAVCPLADLNGYPMNVHLSNYWKLRRWLFSSLAGWHYALRVITNHNSIKPLREYTFEYPLTFEELNLIRNNTNDFIKFAKDSLPQNYRYGWIEEVNHNLKTSLTDFKLITT